MHLRQTSYWFWILGLSGLILASWGAAHGTYGLTIVTGAIAIVGVIVGWKRPAWFVYASLAELVVGGKGYITSVPIGQTVISLREVLFVLLVLRVLPMVWNRRTDILPKDSFRPWVAITSWVALMAVWGIVRGNGGGATFFDANGFLALAYAPLWWLLARHDTRWRERSWTIVLAGSTVVAFIGLALVVSFGHNASFLDPLYHWVRDTGLGEITWINGNVYRVFLQSQLFCVIVFASLLVNLARQQWTRWQWWPVFFAAVGTYTSLSRSFWLGLTGALVVAVVLFVHQREWNWWRLVVALPLLGAAWMITTWATSFPAFLSQGSTNTIVARLTSNQSAQAATARTNQIRPLLTAIRHHPLLGSGFGTSVTYFSTDPRVHGWRTTTAFELGYLDLWLKVGIVGLGLIVWWLFSIVRRLERRQMMSMTIGIMTIGIIHLTTPYLNHPLGLSFISLAMLYAYA